MNEYEYKANYEKKMGEVREIMVGDLDKSKCSYKFLSHNFPDDMIVHIKCDENGNFEYLGKNKEYRIIKED